MPFGILSVEDQLLIDAEVQRLGRGLTEAEMRTVVAQIAKGKGELVYAKCIFCGCDLPNTGGGCTSPHIIWEQ